MYIPRLTRASCSFKIWLAKPKKQGYQYYDFPPFGWKSTCHPRHCICPYSAHSPLPCLIKQLNYLALRMAGAGRVIMSIWGGRSLIKSIKSMTWSFLVFLCPRHPTVSACTHNTIYPIQSAPNPALARIAQCTHLQVPGIFFFSITDAILVQTLGCSLG